MPGVSKLLVRLLDSGVRTGSAVFFFLCCFVRVSRPVFPTFSDVSDVPVVVVGLCSKPGVRFQLFVSCVVVPVVCIGPVC